MKKHAIACAQSRQLQLSLLWRIADYYRDNEPDFKYIRPRVMSFLAYMSHCDGRKTTQHILKNFKLTRGHHDHSL